MSAAYGRALDRHIKLARYKSHPLVVAGEVLKELLHLVATKPAATSNQAKKRQQRSKRSQQQRKRNASTSNPRPRIRWRRTDDWNRS